MLEPEFLHVQKKSDILSGSSRRRITRDPYRTWFRTESQAQLNVYAANPNSVRPRHKRYKVGLTMVSFQWPICRHTMPLRVIFALAASMTIITRYASVNDNNREHNDDAREVRLYKNRSIIIIIYLKPPSLRAIIPRTFFGLNPSTIRSKYAPITFVTAVTAFSLTDRTFCKQYVIYHIICHRFVVC